MCDKERSKWIGFLDVEAKVIRRLLAEFRRTLGDRTTDAQAERLRCLETSVGRIQVASEAIKRRDCAGK